VSGRRQTFVADTPPKARVSSGAAPLSPRDTAGTPLAPTAKANRKLLLVTGSPLRVGLAGAGFIAEYHLQVLRTLPNVRAVAICDPDTGRAERLRDAWNIDRSAATVSAMLAPDDLDVVHVLVPPPFHANVTLAALAADCDVLVEKPLATSTAECRAVAAAAGARGRRVGVNHNNVHHPAFRRLASAIAKATLGRVEHVVACWNAPLAQLTAGEHGHWMFREPANILLEQAVHPLSQVAALIGPFEQVSAVPAGSVRLRNGRPFVDRWLATAVAARGTAQCYFGFGRPFYEWTMQVLGQDGSAFADFRRNTLTLRETTRFAEPIDAFVAGVRAAGSVLGDSTAELARYAGTLMKVTPRADPFFVSMRDSIAAFYGADSPPWGRQGIAEGAAVVSACEAMAAAFEPIPGVAIAELDEVAGR
jgi:predicted dehydrogenase